MSVVVAQKLGKRQPGPYLLLYEAAASAKMLWYSKQPPKTSGWVEGSVMEMRSLALIEGGFQPPLLSSPQLSHQGAPLG